MGPSATRDGGGERRGRTRILAALLWTRLHRIVALYVVVFGLATGAVYASERGAPGSAFESYGDALWFGVVTLSTVGYGDTTPVTPAGRVVTGVFILFTLLTIGFLLSAFSEAILEVKHMEELGLIGTSMKGHVVVCGFGPLARTAIEELLAAGRQVAVLCEHAEDLAFAKQVGSRDRLFATIGEPSHEVLRDRLNLPEATTAIIALHDDAQCLIASLNVRAVSPSVRIVVALHREELRQTLVASGVTYVATPNELGGRLVASAAFEPEVARLVEDLASGATGSCDVQQHPARELAGLTVAEVRRRLDEANGSLLMALARRDGEGYEVIPHPGREVRVGPEDQLIVLAHREAAGPVTG